ncbi:TetR/AcrR family transcriptional regulator [Pseudonocardia acaciae]|uniref:TetR/AcrR family transcriptional regulator n=1 Tax=Pseudonocardia acaciae TaxID=551276 RepID=UPI000686C0A8|nr:TetR/AcrR family transcriptional regulator [Pseudonocardia acaciae]
MSDAERARRILDAAADLALRWGYKRVTVEEVAKRAGVGKGTVYLHFESRAWLFMCVLMRESLGLLDELAEAIRRDPASVLPAEQARLTYLAVQRRPLLRAMFSRDTELLGDLADEGAVEPMRGLKADLANEMFELLRDRGLMRTDLDVDTQRYLLNAVQTGFYLYRPLSHAPEADPEVSGAALAYAVRAAVAPPGEPDPAALAEVAPSVLARCERFRDELAKAIESRPARSATTSA